MEQENQYCWTASDTISITPKIATRKTSIVELRLTPFQSLQRLQQENQYCWTASDTISITPKIGTRKTSIVELHLTPFQSLQRLEQENQYCWTASDSISITPKIGTRKPVLLNCVWHHFNHSKHQNKKTSIVELRLTPFQSLQRLEQEKPVLLNCIWHHFNHSEDWNKKTSIVELRLTPFQSLQNVEQENQHCWTASDTISITSKIGTRKPVLLNCIWYQFKERLSCWKKSCLSLTEIKANITNTYLLYEILKIFIGNMLNSIKESPRFYPLWKKYTSIRDLKFYLFPLFICVSHLEWNVDLTFLTVQRCSTGELNSERKKWIGCYHRPNTVKDVCEFYEWVPSPQN